LTIKVPSDFSLVKDLVMDAAVAIVEAEDDHLQTLAKFISVPSLGFLLLRSANDTKRRDFASIATRRVMVSFIARS
jgi:hypothetical protein